MPYILYVAKKVRQRFEHATYRLMIIGISSFFISTFFFSWPPLSLVCVLSLWCIRQGVLASSLVQPLWQYFIAQLFFSLCSNSPQFSICFLSFRYLVKQLACYHFFNVLGFYLFGNVIICWGDIGDDKHIWPVYYFLPNGNIQLNSFLKNIFRIKILLNVHL